MEGIYVKAGLQRCAVEGDPVRFLRQTSYRICVPVQFVAYASAHGNTPDQQLASDEKRWLGGSMCGFILWKRARLLEFRRVNPDAFLGDMLRDQDGFTGFLRQAARERVQFAL